MREDEVPRVEPVVPVIEVPQKRGWLSLTVLIAGAVIGLAILVMALVLVADFDTGPPKMTPTQGPCEPFCTTTPAPPVR